MNIAQIKQDLDNGVIVSAATWRELVEWAVKVEGEKPIRIVVPPMTETESDKQWHVFPQKIWHVEQSPDEKLVEALKSARLLLANTDGLSKNNIDNLAGEEVEKIDAALAAVGAKEA